MGLLKFTRRPTSLWGSLVAGIGAEEINAGDRELLGKVSVILAEDGNNLRLCQ
jgi:hypothetical protein